MALEGDMAVAVVQGPDGKTMPLVKVGDDYLVALDCPLSILAGETLDLLLGELVNGSSKRVRFPTKSVAGFPTGDGAVDLVLPSLSRADHLLLNSLAGSVPSLSTKSKHGLALRAAVGEQAEFQRQRFDELRLDQSSELDVFEFDDVREQAGWICRFIPACEPDSVLVTRVPMIGGLLRALRIIS